MYFVCREIKFLIFHVYFFRVSAVFLIIWWVLLCGSWMAFTLNNVGGSL